MSLSKEQVKGLADYARIALTADELDMMQDYLNDAITHVLAPIRAFGQMDVEPVFHPIGDLANVMREDRPRPGLPLDEALHNAGQSSGEYFRIPSILGGEAAE